MKSYIENSKVSHNEVEIYKGTRIVNSMINENSIIGDFSRITNSKLLGYNKIDRNSLVYYSSIGLASYLGSNSILMHSEIGKFCSLSWGITIGPANHDYNKISTHDFLYNNFYEINPTDKPAYNRFSNKTKIGNDVWIGANVTVVNGVTIGDGAVVGANTIVTKDVPPYSIVVGNPGKIIKKRFDEETITKLLKLKWWDLPFTIIRENFDLFAENLTLRNIEKLIEIKSKL